MEEHEYLITRRYDDESHDKDEAKPGLLLRFIKITGTTLVGAMLIAAYLLLLTWMLLQDTYLPVK